MAGDRRRLAADALLEVAVAAHGVDVVVERAGALGRVGVEQAALAAGGHGHADGVRDALAERAGGGLDAGGVAVLGVARGLGAPGAEGLEVVELEAEAAEEELGVERDAGVAAGEHEPVATAARTGRRGSAASSSGTGGRRPVPGSSRSRDGRCRPSAPRPWPAPGRCPLPSRRGRSSSSLVTGIPSGLRSAGPPRRRAYSPGAIDCEPHRTHSPPEDFPVTYVGQSASAVSAARAGSRDRRRRGRGVRRAHQATGHRAAPPHHRAGDVLRRPGHSRARTRRRHGHRRHALRGVRVRAELRLRPRHRRADAPYPPTGASTPHRLAARGADASGWRSASCRRWCSPSG